MRDEGRSIKKRGIEQWRIMSFAMMLYDFAAVCGAYFLALYLRFDCVYSAIQARFMGPYKQFILPYAVGCIVLFSIMKMYKSVWRYAGYTELARTLAGSLIASVAETTSVKLVSSSASMVTSGAVQSSWRVYWSELAMMSPMSSSITKRSV